MNRTIKFRAWTGDKMRSCAVSEKGLAIMDFEESKAPLMQFTGSTDTNGKEIYEGDIVKVYSAEEYLEPMEGDDDGQGFNDRNALVSTESIEFSGGGYFLDTSEKLEYMYPIGSDAVVVEIIGNIFENPALLK